MNKKVIKKVAREFRMYGSRLLSTKYDSGMSDLNRFLNFIESNEIILNFINENNQENYDMKGICSSRAWNVKYQLPIEKNKEIAYIYQLLKYGQSNFESYRAFSGGYGSGNKIQDHIDAFNNEVTKHLVDYIREYLEDVISDIDENIEASEGEKDEKKIFISYSWSDKKIADIIDKDFLELGFNLTRDERDLRFKDSIKQFMQSIGKHDYVIMLISDSYLKSENCMYEVLEVMRDREYKQKMLMVVLSDDDKKYLNNHNEKINGDLQLSEPKIGANIYSTKGRIGYIAYWEEKEKELEVSVSLIRAEINKIQPLNELKRINNISRDIGDFLGELSDWKGIPLRELKENNYESILNEIRS
jgi:hypothetical protein